MRYPELRYKWEWRLRSTPERLWPLVADTNRFNRDTGLPGLDGSDDETRVNARRSLRFSRFGIRVEWEEEPFEWVRPYRFGVHRQYRAGPVASTRVLVELISRPGGGTRLVYQTWVRPSNLLGMAVVPLLMKFYNRRAFGAAFRRYDELAMRADPALDQPQNVLKDGVPLAPGGRSRLAALRRDLVERTGKPELVARLVKAVENGDDFDMARLRPYVLAGAWSVPRREVLEVCLHATRAGLFDLRWDLLCPLCRARRRAVRRWRR